MLTIRKSTLRKTGFGVAALLLLAALVMVLSPGQISLADGATCGDGVCDASENSDLCGADCGCVDNGVADPGEGCGCKDVVCDSEPLSSACGTPATVQDDEGNWQCPSGTATDGTTKTLAEFNGVCWDACECEGLCTEEAITAASSSAPAICSGDFSHSGLEFFIYEKGTTPAACPSSCTAYVGTSICTGSACDIPCAAKGLTARVDCYVTFCNP